MGGRHRRCRASIVDRSLAFEARGARHPVVEAAVRRAGGVFTPNDCALDGTGDAHPRLSIVTGPNMAGKSTFLRQNALLAILAQAGCFVPAAHLRLGVVDRLFSRVGAGDDLARGRSTFMAEMVETAAILTNATARSLAFILDATGCGHPAILATAWPSLGPAPRPCMTPTGAAPCSRRTITNWPRWRSVSPTSPISRSEAKEWNGELVFLHEAGPGCADRSYGVQVARLAGVPPAVVARAREVLARLENEAVSHVGLQELPLFAAAGPRQPEPPRRASTRGSRAWRRWTSTA